MPTTTNFGWTTPTVGGDNNAWGGVLNTLFQAIDDDLQATLVIADAAKDVTDELTAAGVMAEQTGLTIYVPHTAFQSQDDETDTVHGDQYLRVDDGSATVRGGFYLPLGVTITQVDLICDKQSQTSMTVNLNKVNASTGALTVVGTGSRSASGVGAATISGLTETVDASFYHLEVTSAGALFGQRIYGAIVTYTRHDLSEVV